MALLLGSGYPSLAEVLVRPPLVRSFALGNGSFAENVFASFASNEYFEFLAE